MPNSKSAITSNLFPYNPNDVDIRRQTLVVSTVLDMISTGEIELWRYDDFQRLSGLWSPKEKSRLIESLLMNIPLPIFYLDGSRMPWKIIDGLQRLTVLDEFINKNAFRLTDLEYYTDIYDHTFDQLSFTHKRTIRNFQLEAYVINPGTPDGVKFNIFQRINTAGVKLNAQELRNAYFSGLPAEFINRLVGSPEFEFTVGLKIPTKRMKNKEFALRFFAFYIGRDLYDPPMDKFLDDCMQHINEYSDEEKKDIYERFCLALRTCHDLFGADAFHMVNMNGKRLTNIPNIALFEAWTVNLAVRNEKIHKLLVRNKEYLNQRYVEYFQIKDFYRAINSSTTSKKSVNLRFNMISDLIDTSI